MRQGNETSNYRVHYMSYSLCLDVLIEHRHFVKHSTNLSQQMMGGEGGTQWKEGIFESPPPKKTEMFDKVLQ